MIEITVKTGRVRYGVQIGESIVTVECGGKTVAAGTFDPETHEDFVFRADVELPGVVTEAIEDALMWDAHDVDDDVEPDVDEHLEMAELDDRFEDQDFERID